MSEKKPEPNFSHMDEIEKENTHVKYEEDEPTWAFGKWAVRSRLLKMGQDGVVLPFPAIGFIGLAIAGLAVTIDEESWLVEAGIFIALVGLVEYFAKNFFMKKK